MLRWLRRSGRLTVPFAIAVVAMVVLGTVDWWHADDEDGLPAFHDHAAHHFVFRAARPAVRAPDHCYLCHWLRTLGNGLGASSHQRIVTTEGRGVLPATACRASALFATLVPARAPPA